MRNWEESGCYKFFNIEMFHAKRNARFVGHQGQVDQVVVWTCMFESQVTVAARCDNSVRVMGWTCSEPGCGVHHNVSSISQFLSWDWDKIGLDMIRWLDNKLECGRFIWKSRRSQRLVIDSQTFIVCFLSSLSPPRKAEETPRWWVDGVSSQFKIDCTTTFSLFSHACLRTGRFQRDSTLFLSCEWRCSVPTLQVVLSFQLFDFIAVFSIFVPKKFRKPLKGILRRRWLWLWPGGTRIHLQRFMWSPGLGTCVGRSDPKIWWRRLTTIQKSIF